MADDRDFEPRLGRIRSSSGGRGKSYLQRVLRAASFAGPGNGSSRPFAGSRMGRGFGAGRILAQRDRFSPLRSRRVVVKTRIVKLRGRGAKAAALHLRYIQRDGVTKDGAPGQLYSRDSDNTYGREFLSRTGEDRHQFRFIVSAEDAGDYDDLKPLVRKLMTRMEADLGTDLDWVAVDHHNTGHPHTHIVLRGRDDRGQDLVIARDYIAHGMRERAAEILTLDLGPRSDLDIETRFARQVTQERVTDLDRLLRRAADTEGHVALGTQPRSVDPHHWSGRLQSLARMGLAEEVKTGVWRLSPELESTLRALGERGDIIKTMHHAMAGRAMEDYAASDDAPVIGKVAVRGLHDEKPDRHYLVIDGLDGRIHYAEIPEGADEGIAPGSIVRVDAFAREPRAVDQTVEAIAKSHNGLYSSDLHRAHDPQARPEFITAHVRRLEAMRRVGRLVERNADGSWAIPADHAANGAAFDRVNDGQKVEVLSPAPLEKMRGARALTWLDRELLAETPVPMTDKGFGHEARQALAQRRNWLVAEGLGKSHNGRTVYSGNLAARLREMELAQAGAALGANLGKPYAAAQDGAIEGICKGSVHLLSGKFAVIEKSRDFTLVPWRPTLERAIGKPVQAIVRGDNASWTIARQRGQSLPPM
jgi:type IV secretory pathway VirD2 relaxase